MKCNLRSCRAIFSKSKPINKAKSATTASFKITEILAIKKKEGEVEEKPLQEGNVIKECLVTAGHSLCNEFRN
jgi:hypothetical protein